MMTQRRRKPGGRRFFPRKKVCQFCVDKVQHIDFKDVPRIRRFVSEWGKIESRRKTGTCSPHQRALSLAIKRARYLALLPYTGAHTQIEMYRPEPRGDRRPRFQDRNAPPQDRAPYRPAAPGTERPGERPSAPSVAPAGAPSQATVAADPAPTPAEEAQAEHQAETGPTGEIPSSAPAAAAPALETSPDEPPTAPPAADATSDEESEK